MTDVLKGSLLAKRRNYSDNFLLQNASYATIEGSSQFRVVLRKDADSPTVYTLPPGLSPEKTLRLRHFQPMRLPIVPGENPASAIAIPPIAK